MSLHVNKMLEFCGKSKIYGPDNKFKIESKLLGKFNLNVLLKMSDFFFQNLWEYVEGPHPALLFQIFLFSADQLNFTTSHCHGDYLI